MRRAVARQLSNAKPSLLFAAAAAAGLYFGYLFGRFCRRPVPLPDFFECDIRRQMTRLLVRVTRLLIGNLHGHISPLAHTALHGGLQRLIALAFGDSQKINIRIVRFR